MKNIPRELSTTFIGIALEICTAPWFFYQGSARQQIGGDHESMMGYIAVIYCKRDTEIVLISHSANNANNFFTMDEMVATLRVHYIPLLNFILLV